MNTANEYAYIHIPQIYTHHYPKAKTFNLIYRQQNIYVILNRFIWSSIRQLNKMIKLNLKWKMHLNSFGQTEHIGPSNKMMIEYNKNEKKKIVYLWHFHYVA